MSQSNFIRNAGGSGRAEAFNNPLPRSGLVQSIKCCVPHLMLEICASRSVGGGGGNILAYPAYGKS
jgi:hypothetical protein